MIARRERPGETGERSRLEAVTNRGEHQSPLTPALSRRTAGEAFVVIDGGSTLTVRGRREKSESGGTPNLNAFS